MRTGKSSIPIINTAGSESEQIVTFTCLPLTSAGQISRSRPLYPIIYDQSEKNVNKGMSVDMLAFHNLFKEGEFISIW